MNLVILIQETPLLLSIYRKLRSIAQIVPYYLVREQLLEPDRVDIHPRLAPLDVLWLSADDMKAISQNKEVRESEATLRRRIEEGLRCLALVHQGKVAAYTWCNLKACQASRKFNFPLGKNEAYLFDARTLKAYRGQRLAPFLRYQLYRELAKTGRTTFYSYTLSMNPSSMRFKEKLGATPIAFLMSVGFLDRWHFNITLKCYNSKWFEVSRRIRG